MSLLVVGSLHLDVVVHAPRLPRLDETLSGTSVDYVFGGKGGNQAIAASRMGADVHFAGRAGSDSFGDIIRDKLRIGGIDSSQLQVDAGASGMSVALVDGQGEYGAVVVSAANLNIESARIRVPNDVTLVLLQNEIPEAVNIDIARKASNTGAQIWLNAAPAREISSELMNLVDLFIVNQIEAEFYASRDLENTLTTLGDAGLIYGNDHIPGYQVEAVSTHGAGDMFIGALAAETIRGNDFLAAIDFAQAAAAAHVSSDLEERDKIARDTITAFIETYGRK